MRVDVTGIFLERSSIFTKGLSMVLGNIPKYHLLISYFCRNMFGYSRTKNPNGHSPGVTKRSSSSRSAQNLSNIFSFTTRYKGINPCALLASDMRDWLYTTVLCPLVLYCRRLRPFYRLMLQERAS